jgi:hypothetical protein
LFADSGNADSPWTITKPKRLPMSVTCQPRGGFVCVISASK